MLDGLPFLCLSFMLEFTSIFYISNARIVTNSSYDASSLPLIGSLGWFTIKEMIEFETATTVYKSLHGLAPEYMQSFFYEIVRIQFMVSP